MADTGTPKKPEPSYAPIYAAALYPDLAKMAREHGYALAVHGSLQRDFDLIAVPWVDTPSNPESLIDDIVRQFTVRVIGVPSCKPHGRMAWTISVGHGSCAIDLSFMPSTSPDQDTDRSVGAPEEWLSYP